jgi:hypothetical protein
MLCRYLYIIHIFGHILEKYMQDFLKKRLCKKLYAALFFEKKEYVVRIYFIANGLSTNQLLKHIVSFSISSSYVGLTSVSIQ